MDFEDIGPQSGVPYTEQQMVIAAKVAALLGEESYWVAPSKNAVFGVYLYSPYAYPNYEYPYQLKIVSFAPGQAYYADSIVYAAGISIKGSINATESMNGNQGWLTSPNTMVWNDGSVWKRTSKPIDNTINQFSAASAYNEAANQSQFINFVTNRAYPNLYKRIPF